MFLRVVIVNGFLISENFCIFSAYTDEVSQPLQA